MISRTAKTSYLVGEYGQARTERGQTDGVPRRAGSGRTGEAARQQAAQSQRGHRVRPES